MYPFDSSRGPLIPDYRDLLLVYFKTVRRYNKTKILRLCNAEFALTDVRLKSSELKSIEHLLNVCLVLKGVVRINKDVV